MDGQGVGRRRRLEADGEKTTRPFGVGRRPMSTASQRRPRRRRALRHPRTQAENGKESRSSRARSSIVPPRPEGAEEKKRTSWLHGDGCEPVDNFQRPSRKRTPGPAHSSTGTAAADQAYLTIEALWTAAHSMSTQCRRRRAGRWPLGQPPCRSCRRVLHRWNFSRFLEFVE